MAEEITDELKDQIFAFFEKKGKMMTTRDVAKGLNLSHGVVKNAIRDMVNSGRLEFTSFGGATFIKIPE